MATGTKVMHHLSSRRDLSMDADLSSSPSITYESTVTMDAMAGPQGTSLRTTSELGESLRNTSSFETGYRSRGGNRAPSHPPGQGSKSGAQGWTGSGQGGQMQGQGSNRNQGSAQTNRDGGSSEYEEQRLNIYANQSQQQQYGNYQPPVGSQRRTSNGGQYVQQKAYQQPLNPQSPWPLPVPDPPMKSIEIDEQFERAREDLRNLSMEFPDSLKSSVSSFSMPSADWEEDLKKYHDELPPYLRIGYIDVLILYHEGDRDKAIEFRDHLINDIDIGQEGPVKAMLYDEAGLQALSTMQIGHLTKAVERSTYIFMYLTKAFTKDTWMEFSSESCLMEAITNPDKQWCVVPVYTERRNQTFRVPMGLNTLKGISYYNNDKFYRNGLARLIGDKVKVRKRLNEELKTKQKHWIETFKRYTAQVAENQRRTQIIEEHYTESYVNAIQYETEQMHLGPMVVPPSMQSTSRNIAHSQSENCMQSVKPQNPAVQREFKELSRQINSGSSAAHSQNRNIVGGSEVMNQYQAGLKRGVSNQSTVSGDMGNPSDVQVHQVHTQHGTFAVDVPLSVWEKIKYLPEKERNEKIRLYFEQTQTRYSQTFHKSVSQPDIHDWPSHYNAMSMSVPEPIMERIKSLALDEQQSAIDFYYETVKEELAGKQQEQSYGEGNRPNLSMMQMEERVSEGQEGSFQSSYDSYNSGSCTNNECAGQVPNLSLFMAETDGLQSNVNPSESQNRPHDGYKGRSKTQQIPEGGVSPVGQRKEVHSEKLAIGKEGLHKVIQKHVHYTINVVGATNVQIGDHNVAQTGTQIPNKTEDDDDSGEESDGEEEEEFVKKEEEDIKSNQEQTTGACEDLELKLGKESSKAGFDQDENSPSRGEIGTIRSGSPNTASSCNVDAAPSTILPREEDLGSTAVGLGKMSHKPIPGGIIQETEIVQTTAKKTVENDESFEVFSKSYMEKSQREDGVNRNISAASFKSSEKQKTLVPVAPMVRSGQKSPQMEKPRAKIATVRPFVQGVSPKENGSDSDNDDSTDQKMVFSSDNTDPKRVYTYSTTHTDNTLVKPFVRNQPIGAENKQSLSAQPQLLTDARKPEEARDPAGFHFSQYTKQAPFYRNQFPPASTGNMVNELDSSTRSVTSANNEQVEVGVDPLADRAMQESNGFSPGTASFHPNLDNNPEGSQNDLEYDMLDSDSFEGTELEEGLRKSSSLGSSKSSRKSNGSVRDKECLIS
ncbi:hypothetical protein MAR_022414 [Mya arenaria]|uniref:Uncharacterized protein n=1 Tax=Mya arenaria TaxID=6604 RepID=A0ABY7DK09_MYAAR|nr:hypothetical protein MAR_022414 [Mya arenaria]